MAAAEKFPESEGVRWTLVAYKKFLKPLESAQKLGESVIRLTVRYIVSFLYFKDTEFY